MRVLVVEDEPDLLRVLAQALREEGYAVDEADNGPDAVFKATGYDYDAVLLDLMLPGVDGWALIETARAEGIGTPIVVVSARGTEHDRVHALEIEELRIDPREVQAYVDGTSAELTPTEFRLLYQLALDRGRVVTRDELLQKLWGRREAHRDRTVDVFVRRLRDKIDRRASRHTFIHTRYGVGYKLEAIPREAETLTD